MSNDIRDTERRPRPDVETRSASHVALQAVETIAMGPEFTLGALAGTGAAMKVKGALGSKGNDSKSSNKSSDPKD